MPPKRGSSSSACCPVASHTSRHSASLPAATMNCPSLASNAWYGALRGCAEPSRFGAMPVPVLARLQCRDAEQAIEHRTVEMDRAPLAQRLATGRDDRVSRVQARGEVGNRHAAFHRRPPRLAGHAHESRRALDHDVERTAGGIRALVPVTGDRAIDDRRLEFGDIVEADPEAVERARAVVLDDYLRMRAQDTHAR